MIAMGRRVRREGRQREGECGGTYSGQAVHFKPVAQDKTGLGIIHSAANQNTGMRQEQEVQGQLYTHSIVKTEDE